MPGKVIELQNKLATPGGITLSAAQRLRIEAAFATFDGTAAVSAFEPCLTFKAPDGAVLSRVRPSSTIAAGASADVSYAPFPGGIGSASGNALPILGFEAFTPVGGRILITSFDPDNPTTIVTAPSITFDGVTTVEIIFGAAAAVVDQRGIGTGGALLIELWDNGAPAGIIADHVASGQDLAVQPCYLQTFDTPSVGAHIYSLRGYKQPDVGVAQGDTEVQASGVPTPHATRPGFFAILRA